MENERDPWHARTHDGRSHEDEGLRLWLRMFESAHQCRSKKRRAGRWQGWGLRLQMQQEVSPCQRTRLEAVSWLLQVSLIP